MKQIKYIAISSLSLTALLFGIAGCSNVDELADSANGEFDFTASQSAVSVSTRAGGTSQFDQNTVYYLYALDNAAESWSSNYINNPADATYTVGTESEAHTITLPSTTIKKFNGRTLNFYGITVPKTDGVDDGANLIKVVNGVPTVSAQYTNGVLPDYLWTNLNDQSYKNSGTITLPFSHRLSKLNFFAQKKSDNANTTEIKVTKIEVCDYQSGTLSMKTGLYTGTDTRADDSNHWVTVFNGSQTLTESSTTLKNGTSDVTPLVFPTRGTDLASHSLQIKITYTYAGTEKTYIEKTADTSDATKAFQFKPNTQYDLNILISNQAVLIVIIPTYYGWINNSDTYKNGDIIELGSPVTFGGVVWADRNLGATSADPTASAMDWERSIGWFYQFGRSIPYYIKDSMQDPNYVNGSTFSCPDVSQSSWNHLNKEAGKPYPYVYGYYHTQRSDTYPVALNGWGSYAYNMATSYTDTPSYADDYTVSDYSADKLAKLPGDAGKYNFVVDFTNGTSYPKVPYDWDYNHTTSATTWQDASYNNLPKNQPCPQGWRLPTVEECLTIYPYDSQCGDICFASAIGTAIIGQAGNPHNTDKRTIYQSYGTNNGGYYTSGYYIDYLNKDGQYVGIKNSGDTYATIYCVKKQGTDKAYRIKWSVVNVTKGATDSRTRQVLKIERFPATSTTSIVNVATSADNSTPKNVPGYSNTLDWDHPSEVLYMPMGGVVYTRYTGKVATSGVALTYPGVEAMYWTATANVKNDENVNPANYAWSLRMRVDNTSDNGQKAIFRYGYDHRGWGGMIRCVRDDSVVK
jgi:hypothetical protein